MDASMTSSPVQATEPGPEEGPTATNQATPRRPEPALLVILLLALSIIGYAGMAWLMVQTYRAEVQLEQRRDLITAEIERSSQRLGALRESEQQAEASAEAARDDAAAMKERLAIQKERLASGRQRLDQQSSALTAVEQSYRERRAALDAATAALEQRRSELAAATKETATLQGKLSDLQARSNAASDDL